MKKILILASNPDEDIDLNYEIHTLKNIIEDSEKLQEFDVIIDGAISPQNIQRLLLEHEPRIVHFCGHGSGENGLVFMNATGEKQLVSTQALSNLFKEFDDTVECVLLNACFSEVQANAIANHINYAIGMNQAIKDDAAIFFAKGFYQALGNGKKMRQCFRLGKNAIELELPELSGQFRKFEALDNEDFIPIPEHQKPVITVKRELTLFPEDITRQKYNQDNQNNFGLGKREQHNLSREDNKHRKRLLNNVENFWIKGVLENSLHTKTLLELEIHARPDLIHNPLSKYQELPVDSDSSYEWLNATGFFEQMGDGRTLLILGEPGSGKTIALLELAKKFIKKANSNPLLPIPVVFNLSSWANKRKPIAEWLVIELKETYRVSKSLAEQWIEQEQLLLLLDGLDEVNKKQRNNCVKAINEFLSSYVSTETVICSRFKDYQVLTEKLNLCNAIHIQLLTDKYINWYLKDCQKKLSGIKIILRQDREIREFAKTPLIFSIMISTFHDYSPEEIRAELSNTNTRHQNLFDNYIEKMFHRKHKNMKYTQEKIIFWLTYLASKLTQESKTIFLIEDLQLSWLPIKFSERFFYLLVSIIIATVLSVITFIAILLTYGELNYGFVYGFICGSIAFLASYILKEKTVRLNRKRIATMCSIGIMIVVVCLVTTNEFIFSKYNIFDSFFSGMSDSLIYGSATWILIVYGNYLTNEIKLYKDINWNWRKGLEVGFKFLLIVTIGWTILLSFFAILSGNHSFIVLGISWGTSLGLLIGSIAFIIAATKNTKDISESSQPNYGIKKTFQNSLIIAFTTSLIIGLIFYETYNAYEGISSGIISLFFVAIFIGGGMACIQHLILRMILLSTGYIPWNYADFLDQATKLIFLQKVGGGYIFIHRMLMEHFAQRHQVYR